MSKKTTEELLCLLAGTNTPDNAIRSLIENSNDGGHDYTEAVGKDKTLITVNNIRNGVIVIIQRENGKPPECNVYLESDFGHERCENDDCPNQDNWPEEKVLIDDECEKCHEMFCKNCVSRCSHCSFQFCGACCAHNGCPRCNTCSTENCRLKKQHGRYCFLCWKEFCQDCVVLCSKCDTQFCKSCEDGHNTGCK